MTPDSTPARAQPTSAWHGFVRRYLFDYPAPARAAWLAITGTGAAALGWALWHIAALSSPVLAPLALALVLVALAAALALKLPRTAYSLSAADVFVFGVLVALGPAAAVLAAGIDGVVGTLRNSKRLSSRISTPAAAMAAMAACGWAFEQTKAVLPLLPLGLDAHLAPMAALLMVALLPFVLTTMPLMTMMALKGGAPIKPLLWLADSAWMAAVYLAAAFIAGIVHLNAQRFGQPVLVISALAALGIVLLLRAALQRQEAERQRQELKVSQARHEAELNQQRFAAAFSHAAIGMVVVKPDGRILQANEALCELLLYEPGGLLGQPLETLLDGADAQLLQRRGEAVLDSADEAFSMETRVRRSNGEAIWVAVDCSQYEDPSGSGHCLIYQVQDINSRRLAESRLHHIAYHDGLTDLANRHCFHERLALAVEKSRQDTASRFAVLYLDLDRFKVVNDSLGHTAGNELLVEVAARLSRCVAPDDLVARLGGDEFAVLVEAVPDARTAMNLADRILDELGRPVRLCGTEVLPSCSVGITFSDFGHRAVDEILRDADLAMYEAKASGRGRVVLFDISMHERVADRTALESDLRRAIGEGQLSVHFQPIYQLEPFRLSGFEALARWVHPQRGPVSPAVFIAMAEESGQIEALTDWIIDAAMAQLARWKKAVPDARHLGMHVNISGRDLARISLVTHVKDVLQRHQATPGSLTLEITETTLMGRLDIALRTMALLRAADVRFSIDDFGTGFSSLAYLGSLPIDSLKIDRSFVMALQDKPQNAEIVRAVLTLAQSLGRKVIAEGIETADQLALLNQLGVQQGQGYLLSRPLRGEQVLELLLAPETTE
jgi:diguanylate cyclase (GGDEF)-like protein/PAS domain S-box-containing protein